MPHDANYLTPRRFYDRLSTLERVTGTFAGMQSRKSVHLTFVANVMHPGSFRAVVPAGLRLNGRIDHVFRMRFPPTTLSRRALPTLRPIANRSINPSRVTNTDAKDTSSSSYWLARQPKWTPRVTRITHVTVTSEIDRKCDRVEHSSLHWRKSKINSHNTSA